LIDSLGGYHPLSNSVKLFAPDFRDSVLSPIPDLNVSRRMSDLLARLVTLCPLSPLIWPSQPVSPRRRCEAFSHHRRGPLTLGPVPQPPPGSFFFTAALDTSSGCVFDFFLKASVQSEKATD